MCPSLAYIALRIKIGSFFINPLDVKCLKIRGGECILIEY